MTCYSFVLKVLKLHKRSLKDEIREGRPKRKVSVVSENIDAVPELIMQDRHVGDRCILRHFFHQHTFNIV